MPNPHDNEERKFSSDEILSYPSQEPRVVNVKEVLGEDIHDALWAACTAGEVKTVKEILEQNNIDINARLCASYTPLLLAVENSRIELTNFFLEQTDIDISAVQHDGGTALTFALKMWHNFEGADYEMARRLINAGADINQIANNSTVLLQAWYRGNPEAANALVLMGADISLSEAVFNADQFKVQYGAEGVPLQINLSKQYLEQHLKKARKLGICTGELCFQFMKHKENSREINSFLIGDSLGREAINSGCDFAFKALCKQFPAPAPTKLLPIPRSLFFMKDFRSIGNDRNDLRQDMINELIRLQHEQEYNRHFPNRAAHGYGPGAMVVYKKS